ncbi:MAG: L-threonylcarbamoyladenylate synthase [Rickettsiaceae bacterium]|nr:L-threonylcarbamoyladenylate synthase [Rickettsiaceae bacterium]
MFVDLDYAISLIKSGEAVIIPTETVYGIAALATSDEAVQKIYQIKRRPRSNPLIVHVSSIDEALIYGIFNEDAQKIAQVFWPGPVTIIVPKRNSKISTLVCPLDSIAIRVPNNNFTQNIIKEVKGPIAAPSANIFTHLTPTTAEHAYQNFEGKIPVLDGGRSVYGIESTIIDCTASEAQIVRLGFIEPESISNLTGINVKYSHLGAIKNLPGTHKKHYSPNNPLEIDVSYGSQESFAINFGESNLVAPFSLNLSETSNLNEAASNFFYMLHEADKSVTKHKLQKIIVARIPRIGLGIVMNDKLLRATG